MKSRSDRAARRLGFAGLALVGSMFAAPSVFAQEQVPPADSSLDALRDRFRAGLEKYRAGAFAEAILIWEDVYRELGPERGYRLTFDLARAYEQFGDLAHAAESYELYLDGVAHRRSAGETIDATVEKQETLARARLEELSTTQARIRIDAEGSVLVKIDNAAERRVPATGLTAYVAPDKLHFVTFDPGTTDERHVELTVGRGEIAVVHPPPLPPRHDVKPAVAASPPPPPPLPALRVRPYDERILYVGAGLTVLSAALPIAFYVHAGNLQDKWNSARASAPTHGDADSYNAALAAANPIKSDYDSARRTAESTLAIPIVLAAATLGLSTYWLLATKNPRGGLGAAPLERGAIAAGRFVF